MSQSTTDRNLLAGILGLQTSLYSESHLISAMRAWVFRKSTNIEDVLLEQGALTHEQRQFLTKLVEQYLCLNGQVPATALSKLPATSGLTESLLVLNDAEVNSFISITDAPKRGGSANSEGLAETAISSNVVPLDDARYKILRPHARGGLGQVSVAEDMQLHREVALKQIIGHHSASTESRNRFLIEAEVTGRLEHPGIVPVYSLGFTKSGPYYVMRFIRGESMKQAIDRLHDKRPALNSMEFTREIRKLIRRLIDAGNAVAYAHSRGVLHRDIKPSNIMLGKYGETLVVDWGLAKTGTKKSDSVSSDEPTFVPLSADSSSETRVGTVVGTLSYMSPEQASGRLDLLSPQSDLYSLGATLYCILTGEAPFDKHSQEVVLQNVREGKFIPPIQKNSLVPKALNAVCLKSMATRMEDRYASVQSQLEDLELWLADEPVSVYREPFGERLMRSAKRHKTAVGIASAVLLSTIVGLLVINILTQRQNAALQIARDDATKAKELAEENSEMARNLSVLLWRNAEEKLTAPEFVRNQNARNLRSELTEASVTTLGKIVERSKSNRELSYDYAQILRVSGNLKRLGRELATANERTLQSLEIQQQIPAEARSEAQTDYLAETFRDLGTLKKTEGNLTAAQHAFASAKNLAIDSLKKHPDSVPYQRTIATIELEESGLLEDLGMDLASYEMAMSCIKRFDSFEHSDKKSANGDFLHLFARARVIKLMSGAGQYHEAEQYAQESIAMGRQVLDKNPNDGDILVPLARMLYRSAGNLLTAKEQTVIAGERLDEAVKRMTELASSTKLAPHISGLASALLYQARYYEVRNELSDADKSIMKSVQQINALVSKSPTPGYLSELAEILHEHAKIKIATGEKPAAIELLQQAKTRQEEACKQSPENVPFKTLLQSITALLDEMGRAN